MEKQKYILKIKCEDRIGLIHKITGLLAKYNLNIEENSEFVSEEDNIFFMRAEFIGNCDIKNIQSELKDILSNDLNISLEKVKKKNIVVLVTKESHCLGDLLIRDYENDVPWNLTGVISNHDDLNDFVGKFNKPYEFISHKDKNKSVYEKELVEKIDEYIPDFIVTAKYMRILSKEFVERYNEKIINIHHSFLPAFVGSNPYKQAHKRGVKTIGATAHFVTEDLDAGPIIVQSTLPITHKMSAKKMASAGRDVEKIVLAKALNLVCENRVFVHGNKTVIF